MNERSGWMHIFSLQSYIKTNLDNSAVIKVETDKDKYICMHGFPSANLRTLAYYPSCRNCLGNKKDRTSRGLLKGKMFDLRGKETRRVMDFRPKLDITLDIFLKQEKSRHSDGKTDLSLCPCSGAGYVILLLFHFYYYHHYLNKKLRKVGNGEQSE